MLGFVNDTALLDWRLAVFSLQSGSSHEKFRTKSRQKVEKNPTKKQVWFDCFLFGYSAVHLNHVVSLVFLCFCMSYATSFSVSSSNKKKKRNNKKRENAEWLFSDGVFLNFKALVFRMHAADMFFADVPGGGSGERRARRPGNTRTRQVCTANAVT